MISFNGKTGRHYRKNTFNDDKYAYSVYRSKDDLSMETGYIGHVDKETALADFKDTEIEEGYIFKMRIMNETKVVRTDLQGNIKESVGYQNFRDYLAFLRTLYGKEFVSYKMEKIDVLQRI